MKYSEWLNLGCGPGALAGEWTHLDGSWNARLAKLPRVSGLLRSWGLLPAGTTSHVWIPSIVIADLRKPLPFDAGEFSGVYASHVLEHLHPDHGLSLLKECFRILRPHGTLRIVVPDLQTIATRYVEEKRSGEQSQGAADRFMQDLHVTLASTPRRHFLHTLHRSLTDLHTHKWMYDSESLIQRIAASGFVAVTRKEFWDSRIPTIRSVELSSRVIDGAGVCVEGVKP